MRLSERFPWYTLVTVALASGPVRRGYRRLGQVLDQAVGTLLIAVGLKLALEQH